MTDQSPDPSFQHVASAPATPPRRRWLRRLLWLLVALLLVVAAAIGGLLWWASSSQSLAGALALAQRLLPQGQTLQYEGVQGSISGGGHITRLRYAMPGTQVEVQDFTLDWSLSQLWHRALHVRTLQAERIHVRLTPQPETPEPEGPPFRMPEQLTLPIAVTLPLRVGSVEIETVAQDGTAATQTIENVAAQYSYDHDWHALQLDSLQYQDSRLRGRLRLHAQQLDVQARVGAWLRNLAPQAPATLHAVLQADGSLAGGEAAQLQVRLDAREQALSTAVPQGDDLLTLQEGTADAAGAPAQLQGQAELHPWRSQPVQQAELALAHLNAQAFAAAAPHTDVNGTLQLRPLAAAEAQQAWQLQADVRNASAGQWDEGLLPVQQLQADMAYAPTQLRIAQLQLLLAAAGEREPGRVTLRGQADPQQLAQAEASLALEAVDMQALMRTLPQTQLGGTVSLAPLDGGAPVPADLAQARWAVAADLSNAQPGMLDQQRLPVRELLAKAQITPERWSAETLQAHIGDGSVTLQGHYAPQTRALEVQGLVQALPLVQMHSELAAGQVPDLGGSLTAAGQLGSSVAFDVDIASQGVTGNAAGRRRGQWDVRAIQTKGQWTPQQLQIERVHLDAFQARVDSSGVRVALPDAAEIEAAWTAQAPGLQMQADTRMHKTDGSGRLELDIASAEQFVAWLHDLPMAAQMVPALQAQGATSIRADWQGGWQQWLEGLQRPAAQPQLRMHLQAQSDGLQLVMPAAEGAQAGGTAIDVRSLDVNLQGNLAAATLAARLDATANGIQANAQAQAALRQQGGSSQPQWQIAIERLAGAATLPQHAQPWQLQVDEGLQVTVQTGNRLQLTTSAGQARLMPPAEVAARGEALTLRWEPLRFAQAPGGAITLQTRGQLQGLVPAWIDGLLADNPPLRNAGVRSTLVLDGSWDVELADTLQLQAVLQRSQGDIWLTDVQQPAGSTADGQPPGLAAGIRAMQLRAQSQGQDVEVALTWDTARAGVINGQARTTLARQGGSWSLPPQAPLSGRVQAQLPDLSLWGALAPPGWRITGALSADVALAGTVQAPQLQGPIRADSLNLRSVLDGVDLHEGQLRADLQGNRLLIESLTFQGGTGSNAYVRGLSGNRTPAPTERGSMTASGTIDWSGVANAAPGQTGIAMDVRAQLDAMQVLVRNDRQVSISGELAAGLSDGALRVRGNVNVDRASITLPESGAPTLGSDVVVVRGETAENEVPLPRGQLTTAQPMDMAITLNLGRDFALQGYGITTRLEGELTIRSATSGNDPVSIVGEIRTDEGRYRAFGQALDVETGLVLFSGPMTNPSLNLLALRPNLPDNIRAGVRVTGTALAPRVQLYSEPTLPESETLSWVVLGRAPGAGSDGNAMQQAALGLLAGSVGNSLAQGLGFDEVGLSESGVSIGKRLSDQLYVTYEAGLSGAASTLYVFYDITRRLTARGETGEQTAVDLIYTLTYD
ncbi:hypothetical protein AAV94_04295 [Lampropedia cohaerens]|uniref:Translocation and assembly module TamB C-terminal domain-containing protein n=1 Tax=Lampropedia cohaerens TaxID=1610491 RepID=A0A0U1Q1G7_9BURK|nr:translocation/assembly module TamB domain-containing protein [Lampropedia cohaerens]KKW68590.1 hypothetical protein AAV94_04295 [Lampropedia cohaerens]